MQEMLVFCRFAGIAIIIDPCALYTGNYKDFFFFFQLEKGVCRK